MSIAGSHWKGDASGRQLQRLYGTAFFDKKELKAVSWSRSKRPSVVTIACWASNTVCSRSIPKSARGCVCGCPKGARVRVALEDFLRKELLSRGYDPVYSPHIGRVEMYETSGHFPYYRDSQFAPLFGSEVGGDAGRLERAAGAGNDRCRWRREADRRGRGVRRRTARLQAIGFGRGETQGACTIGRASTSDILLKPMNCPHHCQIFKAQPRSYRQLPLRLFEFGTVYRHEQTGELNGMLRVRGLTQDDCAHLLHRRSGRRGVSSDDRVDQVRVAVGRVGRLPRAACRCAIPTATSTSAAKRTGIKPKAALRGVLEQSGLEFNEEPGEAAFYGPKADFMVRDCIGRSWQLGTVQLDYNLPERFKLEYNGSDNAAHRPVMIHRAPFGSLERFTGMLIEHFAGAFPLWLSPEQIRVLPLSDKSLDYAVAVAKELDEAGLKVTVDSSGGKVQAKIRNAQLDLVNYMAVVGPKEAEAGHVALRDRIDGDLGSMPTAEAIARLKEEIATRQVRQVVQSSFTAAAVDSDAIGNEY